MDFIVAALLLLFAQQSVRTSGRARRALLTAFGSVKRQLAASVAEIAGMGPCLGFIVDRPIFELLGITEDTSLEVETDGEALITRSVKLSKMDRVITAADERMDAHEETFRNLAE